MIKLIAATIFIFGLIGTASTIPATAQFLSDTGIWDTDTGSNDSGLDSGIAAVEDTGSHEEDTGANPDDTGEINDENDTGDTGAVTENSSRSYSAAQLANDKGGCSATGGTGGPWVLALFGLLAGRRRR